MQKTEKTVILVQRGKAKEIASIFGVSSAMVSKSLRGIVTGGTAKKIRHTALTQYDGKEMQPVNSTSKEV